MKNRLALFVSLIFFVFLLTGCTKPEVSQADCSTLTKSFDEYAQKSRLPVFEADALCHGLYVSDDFSKLPPKWAIGKLTAINSSGLVFEGIAEQVAVSMGVASIGTDKYEIGRYYKVDMNNICKGFLLMVDSRYPSPIAETFVEPQEVNCIASSK